MSADYAGLLSLFRTALDYAQSDELVRERAWQYAVSWKKVTESEFLREAAWVILCCGFRERAVRACFEYLSFAFCDWESAHSIVSNREACVDVAKARFANLRKLEAIVDTAVIIYSEGFDKFICRILSDPLSELQSLPFIGPVTSLHLAKNIGVDVAKPDRHLVRIAVGFGFDDVASMCAWLSRETSIPARVVDLTLWRYAADGPKT